MLLSALADWAEQQMGGENDLGPKMYAETAIKWFILLDHEGTFEGIVPAGGGGKQDRGKMMAPQTARLTDITARLLADNGEYVLGVGRDSGKTDRNVDVRHRAFVESVRQCAAEINEPSVKAVLGFLDKGPMPVHMIPEGFEASDVLTFKVDGMLPIQLPSVQRYWAAVSRTMKGRRLRCLLCDKVKFCPESHPFRVKGVRGGNLTGMAISSANARAFESYGLSRSLNAPTCLDCSELAIKALNKILQHEDHHVNIGPVSCVFWCKGAEFNPTLLLSDPQRNEMSALLQTPWDARAVTGTQARFFAAALTANKARVVVRDWIDTPLEQAKANLSRYFVLQEIVDYDGTEGSPCSIFGLAAATVRSARDLPARTPVSLLHFVFHGGVLPLWLLAEAVRRNRAEQAVTRSRAALIKLVLLSEAPNCEEGNMVRLDVGEFHPAYLCGRLLADLDKLQRQAMGRKIMKSSDAERFYGAASVTPSLVFPTLLRRAEAHFAKLRAPNFAARYTLRGQLEEILCGLKHSFPSLLTTREQGLFALGYYHQRAHDRAQARERKEQKVTKRAAAE